MLFKIKKNNLFAYFPLNKEPKYKTLEKFQDNFARFELPNGQGWIDLTENIWTIKINTDENKPFYSTPLGFLNIIYGQREAEKQILTTIKKKILK